MQNLTLLVVGFALLLYFSFLLLFRRSILSSAFAKVGGGLKSYFSGQGISADARNNFRVTEGMILDKLDEKGRPIARSTRRIHP